jgi:hypothetical protein
MQGIVADAPLGAFESAERLDPLAPGAAVALRAGDGALRPPDGTFEPPGPGDPGRDNSGQSSGLGQFVPRQNSQIQGYRPILFCMPSLMVPISFVGQILAEPGASYIRMIRFGVF